MVSNERIRVHPSLIEVFDKVGREFAEDIKKKYNLDQLDVTHATLSQLVANKVNKNKKVKFKVIKTGPKSGTLVLN